MLEDRANVGCGASPTPTWLNFDNSPSVRLATHPWLLRLLGAMRLLSADQVRFAKAAASKGIRRADVSRRIPLPDSSLSVLYSSHMLDQLERREALAFLSEARRVLRKGGILRLALSDLALHVEHYRERGDADEFIEATLLAQPAPRGFVGRLRFLLLGARTGHRWLYDGPSISALLTRAGFDAPTLLPAGRTTIADPGPLDLAERVKESLYVEARRP